MCLIFVALDCHARYPLIIAANRDEFHTRPTRSATFWDSAPDLIAGRDLQAGGTWLGMTRSGAWAAVTNYREPQRVPPPPRSRGDLVTNYLRGDSKARDYAADVIRRGAEFSGFSLLVGDGRTAVCVSNRDSRIHTIKSRVVGLSNGLFDEPWPKVVRGKNALRAILAQPEIDPQDLLELLADRTEAAIHELPNTGVGVEREKWLSPAFITGREYGTRSSTVILAESDGDTRFVERTFPVPGDPQPPVDHTFRFRIHYRAR